jgi:hypothetical protein
VSYFPGSFDLPELLPLPAGEEPVVNDGASDFAGGELRALFKFPDDIESPNVRRPVGLDGILLDIAVSKFSVALRCVRPLR